MKSLVPAGRPTMYFIGVSTAWFVLKVWNMATPILEQYLQAQPVKPHCLPTCAQGMSMASPFYTIVRCVITYTSEPSSERAKSLPLTSNHDPFDFIEGYLILPSVIETSCARAFVIGHRLSNLELPAVSQVLCDVRCPKRVATYFGADVGASRPAGYHAIHVRPAGRLLGRSFVTLFLLEALKDCCKVAAQPLSSVQRQAMEGLFQGSGTAMPEGADQLAELLGALHDHGTAVFGVTITFEPAPVHKPIEHARESARGKTKLIGEGNHAVCPGMMRFPEYDHIVGRQSRFLGEGREVLPDHPVDIPEKLDQANHIHAYLVRVVALFMSLAMIGASFAISPFCATTCTILRSAFSQFVTCRSKMKHSGWRNCSSLMVTPHEVRQFLEETISS